MLRNSLWRVIRVTAASMVNIVWHADRLNDCVCVDVTMYVDMYRCSVVRVVNDQQGVGIARRKPEGGGWGVDIVCNVKRTIIKRRQ